jgi:hypothetical protein
VGRADQSARLPNVKRVEREKIWEIWVCMGLGTLFKMNWRDNGQNPREDAQTVDAPLAVGRPSHVRHAGREIGSRQPLHHRPFPPAQVK